MLALLRWACGGQGRKAKAQGGRPVELSLARDSLQPEQDEAVVRVAQVAAPGQYGRVIESRVPSGETWSGLALVTGESYPSTTVPGPSKYARGVHLNVVLESLFRGPVLSFLAVSRGAAGWRSFGAKASGRRSFEG